MNKEKISAHQITRPIQLWAAWLVGLTTVVGLFLWTSLHLPASWERSALIVSVIIYVPTFLFAALVLQTRFRDQLLEDVYYTRIKNRKTDSVVTVSKIDELDARLSAISKHLNDLTPQSKTANSSEWDNWKLALNISHPAYADLKGAFAEAGIPISVAFGERGAPSEWVVAIHKDMPKRLAIKILSIAAEFKFDGFVFWYPIRDVGETEDVYIGSYGISSFTTLSQDFAEHVVDELSLSEYIDAHTSKINP